MPNYFITFRAHDAEPDVFEDWVILLLKKISKKKFDWQIEWDETPSRHIHLLLFDIRDNNVITQMWNGKAEIQFRDYLKSKLTNWSGDVDNCAFCKVVRINDQDPKNTDYYTGYIHKHSNLRGKCHESITSEYIMECVNYYYTIKKLDKREEKNNNIKLITNKNIYQNLISFVNNPENETSFSDKSLKYKSVKLGHFGYTQVSERQQETAFTELRIMNDQERPGDKNSCNAQADRYILEPYKSQDELDMESFAASKRATLATDLYKLMRLLDSGENPEFTLNILKKKYPNYDKNG